MAIAAIYILLTISFVLFYMGINRSDPTLAMFASFLFIFSGLHIVIYGFEELTAVYARSLGFIIICLGGYIGIRSGMEWISESM